MKLQWQASELDALTAALNLSEAVIRPEAYVQEIAFPPQVGEGMIRQVILRPGVELYCINMLLHQPVEMEVQVDYPHLEVSYTHAGQGSWGVDGRRENYDMFQGKSSLIFMRDARLNAQLQPGCYFDHVELRMDARAVGELLPGYSNIERGKFLYRQTSEAPRIRLLVEQIKACPYTGKLGQLYLESKAMEWLAVQWATIGDEEQGSKAAARLTRDDLKCLHAARELLEQTWRNPPALLELARRSGINDYKLKAGFRQVFGTTVFGYVRGLRMQEAHRMLELGYANVTEAAGLVGYQNPSHFAALFKRTFGYNPKDLSRKESANRGF